MQSSSSSCHTNTANDRHATTHLGFVFACAAWTHGGRELGEREDVAGEKRVEGVVGGICGPLPRCILGARMGSRGILFCLESALEKSSRSSMPFKGGRIVIGVHITGESLRSRDRSNGTSWSSASRST